jgi:hypothetical protein
VLALRADATQVDDLATERKPVHARIVGLGADPGATGRGDGDGLGLVTGAARC